jgi:hypothetical protein
VSKRLVGGLAFGAVVLLLLVLGHIGLVRIAAGGSAASDAARSTCAACHR